MTRINTNVSSLIAQKTLSRTNADLQTSLTRLSTGLRINTGKDDPAGLIASENLRRDIVSIQKAVSNSERANQLIATADSALGQVSQLLNDIRGLVTEAANTGALSDEQIAANQLQIDSSLEAIDRIAQVTTFQGRKILDGSLSFLTQAGTGFTSVRDLKIDQANLGTTGSIAVGVTITAAATQAQITNSGVGFTAGAASTGTLSFSDVTTPGAAGSGTLTFTDITTPGAAATGTLTFTDITTPESQASSTLSASGLSDAGNAVGTLDVLSSSSFAGAAGDDLEIVFAEDNLVNTHSASLSGDTLTITVGTLGAGATISLSSIFAGLSGESDFTDNVSSTVSAGDYTVGTDAGQTLTFSGGVDEVSVDDEITITASATGAAFNGTITVVTDPLAVVGSIDVQASGGNITITLDNSSTYALSDIADAIDTHTDYTATLSTNAADGNFVAGTDTDPTGVLAGGVTQVSANDVITITALEEGSAFNGTVNVVTSNTATTGSIDVDFTSGVLTITLDDSSSYALADIATAIGTQLTGDFSASVTTNSADGNFLAGTDTNPTGTIAGGVTEVALTDTITITAANTGTAFNGTINVVTSNTATTGSIAATFASGTLTITLDDSSTYDIADISDAINTQLGTSFTASVTATAGDGDFVAGTDTNPTGTLAGGTADGGAGLAADLVVEIAGRNGSEVFSFQAGSSLSQIISAINLVSDATGVTASEDSGDLSLASTDYGTAAFVDVNVISEGTGGTFTAGLSATRTTGTDINASVNGVQAKGDGNTLSINTATLDLSLTVSNGSNTAVNFTITGGGALFQLGPDVVSNQQARLGIQSVNTGRLGGVNGKLFELRSGGTASLSEDTSRAARIVDETIDRVTSLRGRLGAFQKTTLDTNIFALNDTLANLTDAESSIRDADFALESARLTRNQILVQSGTSVLAIANSNPQNVLALLR